MKFPGEAGLERLRRTYPKGTKVRLLAMDDIQAPPVGTNGSSLSLIPGADEFEILEE